MTTSPRTRHAAPAALVAIAAVLALTVLAPPALGNGGTVRIADAPVGPWLVTVYSSPTPLRTGEVDISTLVLDSAGATMDVPIAVDATPIGFVAEGVQARATRRQATNKLFKAAKFDIGVPGEWDFRVRIGSAAGPTPAGTPVGEAAGESAATPEGGPGGVVSFQAVVVQSTILDRPFLLGTLVALPLLVLGWLLLGREPEEVSPGSPR